MANYAPQRRWNDATADADANDDDDDEKKKKEEEEVVVVVVVVVVDANDEEDDEEGTSTFLMLHKVRSFFLRARRLTFAARMVQTCRPTYFSRFVIQFYLPVVRKRFPRNSAFTWRRGFQSEH